MKWNVYHEIDGMWDVVRVVESDTKPKAKRGQKVHKAPRAVVWQASDYNPVMAFPAAYGLGIRDVEGDIK